MSHESEGLTADRTANVDRGASYDPVVGDITSYTPWAPAAFSFVAGNYYTSDYSSRVITQYRPDGAIVGSYTIPSTFGNGVQGIAFGPDGLLYACVHRGLSGFAVLALDSSGTVQASYAGSTYVAGSVSYGKIALDTEYLYVCGQNQLTRFRLGSPASGTVIYSTSQIHDVKVLPTGNLFVGSAYAVDEITASGAFVRTIALAGDYRFVDLVGIEYNPATNILFVTHLGSSNFAHRIMAVDASTGALLNDVVWNYAGDLFLDPAGSLLVGSRTQVPTFFSQQLQMQRALGGGQQLFVTQYAAAVPQSVVSRKQHSGAGALDIDLPLTGVPAVECRAGGATSDYMLVLTFSAPVSVTGNPQAQVSEGTGMIGSGGVSNSGMVAVDGSTVTVPLTNMDSGQTVRIKLKTVISSTGTSDVTIPMSVLIGDTTGNGSVNASDIAQTKLNSGAAVGAANFRSDVNASGSINTTDISIVKSRAGSAINAREQISAAVR